MNFCIDLSFILLKKSLKTVFVLEFLTYFLNVLEYSMNYLLNFLLNFVFEDFIGFL